MEPSFEPTGSPTNSSTPTYAPTQMISSTSISGNAVSLVIMTTMVFIVICVLYTCYRSKTTSRIEVE